MATRYYQVPLGGNEITDVTEAGSSSLAWVEVAIVFDATGNSKQLALLALDAVRRYLERDAWPPNT